MVEKLVSEAETVALALEDVRFDLLMKPGLFNMSSTKPFDVVWPLGSASLKLKFGLMDSSAADG